VITIAAGVVGCPDLGRQSDADDDSGDGAAGSAVPGTGADGALGTAGVLLAVPGGTVEQPATSSRQAERARRA
jgi:hypothetical protein